MNYVKTFLLVIFILACSSSAFAETITMTTYYPSPSGNYNNMTNGVLTITDHIYFTNTPGTRHLFSGINGDIFYLNPTAAGGLFASSTATGLALAVTGATVGNVGIGGAPSNLYKLNVNGTINTTGSVTSVGVVSSGQISASAASNIVVSGTGAVRTNRILANSGALVTIENNTTVSGNATVTGTLGAGATTLANLVVNGANPRLKVDLAGDVTAHAFMHWSDESLKEDIVPITGAIDKVKAINGVYFKYKGKEEQSIGLIAQNVEKVVPEVVVTGADGIKTVDYSALVPLLIEAVKEQQVIIEELQRKASKNK
jgi:hypothetical protein